MRTIVFVVFTILSLASCNSSNITEDTWRNYIGEWKALDGSEMLVSFEIDMREGKEYKKHAAVSIKDMGKLDSLPKYYLVDGTWSWQLGPNENKRKELNDFNKDVLDGIPTFTVHPFEEFMYRSQTVKNPDTNAPNYMKYIDKVSYIGQIHPDTLVRLNKDHPPLKLLRIK